MSYTKTLAMLLIFQFGCATIVQRGPDHKFIDSSPNDAEVFLNGRSMGKTPLMLSLKRSEPALIQIKKEGYNDITVQEGRVLAGWTLGNIPLIIIIYGIAGIIVDLAAGNTTKYSDEPKFFELTKSSSASISASPTP